MKARNIADNNIEFRLFAIKHKSKRKGKKNGRRKNRT